jgi:hypothetical protein
MVLTKSDLKQLDTRFEKQETRIKKLLLAQDIKTYGKMEELEEKFEKKVTEVKSELFEKIDPILKEVVSAREEKHLIKNRIEALEDIHQTGKHSLATL